MAYGASCFEPHVFLELILGYSIPRKDTNPIAHELINKFGSLEGVFSASVNDLITVSGVTEHTAILIKLFSDYPSYITSVSKKPDKAFTADAEAEKFIVNILKDLDYESVWVFCVGNNKRLKSYREIHKGDINTVRFSIKSITEAVFSSGCKYVILAHNHPSGNPIPSVQDIDTTKRIADSLASNSIYLAEHYVVGGDSCIPVMKYSRGEV